MTVPGSTMTAGGDRPGGPHLARVDGNDADPVRAIGYGQGPALVRHLARLPVDDRRLRFGTTMSDAMIEHYVAGIDFSRDRVFGVAGPAGTLIGMAHLALDPLVEFAEIGLSVEQPFRDKGYGYMLLQRAIHHAANSGYRTLFMHCLDENAIMKHLARKAGLKVVTAHGEAHAHIALCPEAHGGEPAEVLDGQALIDTLFRQELASFLDGRLRVSAERACASTSAAP